MRPIIKAADALITVEYKLFDRRWCARAQYIEHMGFNIDVFRDGARWAVRDGVLPIGGEGNRDVALVSETLDLAVKEQEVAGLRLVIREAEKSIQQRPARRIA